jgi:hypothetical protein
MERGHALLFKDRARPLRSTIEQEAANLVDQYRATVDKLIATGVQGSDVPSICLSYQAVSNTRLYALTLPMPVAISQPGVAPKEG